MLDGHGGDLAEEDHPALVPQEGVGVAQAVHPGGDGGRGEGALGGQAPPDQGVEHRQRELDGVPVGAAGVEEGADRLLRKPEVRVRAERNDGPGGDRGGVEREQDLVPLPGVDGQQEIAVGFVATGGQFGAEGGVDLRVELLGVETVGGFEARHSSVRGEAIADGDPRQPARATGFGAQRAASVAEKPMRPLLRTSQGWPVWWPSSSA